MSLMMDIVLDRDAIAAVDLSSLTRFCAWIPNPAFFTMEPGKEHYKLLASLSHQIDKPIVVDIGHYQGLSAIALSHNTSKIVRSFDVVNCLPTGVPSVPNSLTLPNVSLTIGTDYMKRMPEYIHDCALVMLDIDHSGRNEAIILNELIHMGFKGIMICDDIYLNDEMKAFWASVSLQKYDISRYGHWSGTGLINFAPEAYNIVLK